MLKIIMAKKQLPSGLKLTGISPNILLQHVDNTAPFLFQGELDTTGPKRAYLEKLRFYKKNLKQLKHINLSEYFHLCLAAHWATAGTFVPTDVDNQIRESLWKHQDVNQYIDKMTAITLDAWTWDFNQVTNRKSYNQSQKEVMSTHEGTWLSVAIGCYCALISKNKIGLAQDVADAIIAEAKKEEHILHELRESRDHINFLRAAPLMAHNFGDLDRVMLQWNMNPDDSFFKYIFKLGHELNPHFSKILVYAGQVNKEFSSKENHRHMSMRQPKCLRKSHKFLIPVGPFMDDWGRVLGETDLLSMTEKLEIIAALYEGYTRQDQAFGYIRAYGALMNALSEQELNDIHSMIPVDLKININQSPFGALSKVPLLEFENHYKIALEKFICPVTQMKF